MELALTLPVKLTASLIRTLGRSKTFDPLRNPSLSLGTALGCSAGLLSVALVIAIAGVGGGRFSDTQLSSLLLVLFLAHPVLGGFLLGVLGTAWRDRNAPPPSPLDTFLAAGPSASRREPFGLDRMMDLFHGELERARRSGRPLTVIVFEADEARDDRSIREVAEAISPVIRESDLLGRLFGGRLLLIAHGDLPCGLCLVDRAARAVRERTHLTLQAGIARWPEDGVVPTTLLQAADLVLKASWHPRHEMHCPKLCTEENLRTRVSA